MNNTRNLTHPICLVLSAKEIDFIVTCIEFSDGEFSGFGSDRDLEAQDIARRLVGVLGRAKGEAATANEDSLT